MRREERYVGARGGDRRHRKAKVVVLKMIRCLMGSQPSSFRRALGLVSLPLRSVRRAAAFWTLWRQSMVFSGSPARRELQ